MQPSGARVSSAQQVPQHFGGFQAVSAKPQVQTVVEHAGMDGYVVAGTPRSIGLVIDDARRHGAAIVYIKLASGEGAWLPLTDEKDHAIPWAVREVKW
jgi:hypothetical protein